MAITWANFNKFNLISTKYIHVLDRWDFLDGKKLDVPNVFKVSINKEVNNEVECHRNEEHNWTQCDFIP